MTLENHSVLSKSLKAWRAIGCRGPDPRELALGAFRRMFGFSVVCKEDGCGLVQKGEGECGSETDTGQGSLVVGFLDGTGAWLRFAVCKAMWQREELCDAPSLRRLQDNGTVSWGLQEAQRLRLGVTDPWGQRTGAVERKETAPTWPKGRQISMWEGAKVWVEWSTLKILCLFLSLRVGVEKIEKTALSMTWRAVHLNLGSSRTWSRECTECAAWWSTKLSWPPGSLSSAFFRRRARAIHLLVGSRVGGHLVLV